MARSGSVNFSVTASAVITKAARIAGILGDGQTMGAAMTATLTQSLNMLVKQWIDSPDLAPGMKVWTRRRGTLFLQQNQSRYLIGPSGDHATDSFVETTLVSSGSGSGSGGWALGAWSIGAWDPSSWVFGSGGLVTQMTLESTDGISDGDYIGIWLDDGSVHWTTVDGTPSGGILFLAEEIPSTASEGARVVAYTTKARRPLELLTSYLRDSDQDDRPLKFLTLPSYDGIRRKNYEKDPDAVFFEAQLDNAHLYIDCVPQDVTKDVKFTYLSEPEDLDAPGNEFDYPSVWYLPLSLKLAMLACVEYKRPVSPDLRAETNDAMTIARNQYPEICEEYFQPELY